MHQGTDAQTLAAYVTAVIQGMSTLARDGASREKLTQVAGQAIWLGGRTGNEIDASEPTRAIAAKIDA